MFKRRKLKSPPVSMLVSQKINQVHKRCAVFLNRKTRNWNRRQQKCFLLILCLAMSGMSTLTLSGIFNINNTNTKRSRPLTTVSPVTRSPVISKEMSGISFLSDTLIFYRFRKVLDSLQQTPEGRKAYTDFLQQRPAFIDSLVNAEKMLKQTFPH